MAIVVAGVLVGGTAGPARGDEPEQASAEPGPLALHPARSELVEQRTATSDTFALPRGERETRLYAEPVRYRDSSGEWQPITEGFRWAGGQLEDRSHPFEIHLPSRVGGGPVRFGGEKHWISFELEGPEGRPAELEGDGGVSYEVPGIDTDVEYETLPQGLKETVELAGPEAVGTLHYRLETAAGVTPESGADGSIIFRSNDGRPVASIPAPTVEEAGSSVEVPGVASYSLSPRESGGWNLALEVEPSWLESPELQWPVTIDPTVLTGTAQGVYDCDINSASATTPYCTEGTLVAVASWHKSGLFGESSYTSVGRALLNFEWEKLNLPAKVEVQEASLNLYAPAAAENVDGVEARPLTKSWDSNKVSWNCRVTESILSLHSAKKAKPGPPQAGTSAVKSRNS